MKEWPVKLGVASQEDWQKIIKGQKVWDTLVKDCTWNGLEGKLVRRD